MELAAAKQKSSKTHSKLIYDSYLNKQQRIID